MYFKRDIDKKLLKHFSQENPTPLIVRGAPDVGKFTSLLNLTGNFKIVKVIDLTDFKSRSNIKFNSKLEPRNVGTDDYTQLEFLIQSETGEEFLEDPNNLLILRNADHVFGLLSIVSRLGKYNNCKIAVTVISPHFFGDTSYLVTDLTIIGMKTMTIKEFSKAYNTYRTTDMGARETVNEDELSSGKYLYEILYYAEYLEEDVVVYRALDALAEEPFKVWVRPVKMFESEVDMEKYPNIKQQYRFELALRRTNNSTIMMNH